MLGITYEFRKTRPQWFGRVLRSEEDSAIMKVWILPVDDKRSMGRQRLRMRDVVRRDMEVTEVVEEGAMDRTGFERPLPKGNTRSKEEEEDDDDVKL